uniref:GPI ethanolamine phosphate transferase 2 C-terminal domain-containing protein n=1 Tax=Brassica campestris TaxID=3711 RepID=M4FBP6_BRACM
MTCTRLTILTVVGIFLQIIGLSIFVFGFFPVKPTLSGVSGSESYRHPLCDPAPNTNESEIHPEKLRLLYQESSGISSRYDRLILMVIDGLPAEFVLGKDGQPPWKVWKESMPYTQSLLANGDAIGYHAKAAPPTVTMPRLKVKDTVQVDKNVSRHLPNELNKDDWNLLILHYLGLDHVGHTGGRNSPLMASKLKEMDDVVRTMHSRAMVDRSHDQGRTLLIVVSDHGMTENGNHGGSSYEETDSLMLFIGLSSNISDYAGATNNLAFQIAALYYMGMAGHFALGNSNTLATIDVAGAFIGISSHSTILSGILMFMITYASPLLFLLSLVMYIGGKLRKHSHLAHSDTDLGQLLKLKLGFPCLVPLCINSILLTAYTVVLLLMRNHLFVWSVFSPKYLYVCATTVCTYVGVCIVAVTVAYALSVTTFLRSKTQQLVVDS